MFQFARRKIQPPRRLLVPVGRWRWSLMLALCGALVSGSGCRKEVAIPKSTQGDEVPPEEPLEEVSADPEPVVLEVRRAEPVVDQSATVAVLGYHDFTDKGFPTEMKIRAEKFRNQMQALKDARIPVIRMSDYIAWRRGEKPIPRECVVITIDDGWRETHTFAMPILQQFGYPFTIYLYTKFLGIGGRSLSDEQVRELLAAGAEIASHSVSHELMTARDKFADDEAYTKWLTEEIATPKRLLEERFGVEVTSFAYPFGGYNARIARMVEEAGYTLAVTVNGAKAGYETPLFEVPRFIIHGANDSNWKLGTTFRDAAVISESNNLLKPAAAPDGSDAESLVRTWPAEGETIKTREPLVRIDFSGLDNIDPASIEMTVGGFGEVTAEFDPETRVLTWQAPRKMRTEVCAVQVRLRRAGEAKPDVVAWTFRIDRMAHYLTPPEETGDAQGDVAASPPKVAEPVRPALPAEAPGR